MKDLTGKSDCQISSLSNLSEERSGGFHPRREFQTEAILTLVLLVHAVIFLAGIVIITPHNIIIIISIIVVNIIMTMIMLITLQAEKTHS